MWPPGITSGCVTSVEMTFDRSCVIRPHRPGFGAGSTEHNHRWRVTGFMDCYVYCLCAHPAPEIQGTFGIQDSRIHCIEYDGLIAVTADSSGCPDPSVANLIAHNRVVNSVLRFTTPVPCKF